MPNDDELHGKADQIKGRVKDAVGKATGDERKQYRHSCKQ
jgi:uncharacterized protein YjbJ (UPF0337 family)